ncbi:putative glutamate-5-semialdehyde dehydrogenase, Glutamate 5-kinase [Helianthus annuus]|uniref:Glutamate-5-semialdehyde dehydrogenase, Glutamate 5-kinase n=1 Tax=Helianthus annuus TaxID=4232 RepID=A0A9K3HGW8_HELAN|nr:putative glutamate-5-semialdehyde dehydrogenase, Glutamate 5-kinase [Helianthus annuus]KAJ0675071.1 putative glutamate-5-semialdehyde dehydrogenase, Glutamate 5-kinase [Helianthus annuus]
MAATESSSLLQLSDGFILEKMSSPLGVLFVIFESRPEALVQIASLAIKTGNGLLLMEERKETTLTQTCTRSTFLNKFVDTTGYLILLILYGICHVYVDKSADMEKAKNIVLDAKTDYPGACNAIHGVSINGGPRVCSLLNLPAAPSFHHGYNSLNCTIEIVDDVHAAVEHIHTSMEGKCYLILFGTEGLGRYWYHQGV